MGSLFLAKGEPDFEPYRRKPEEPLTRRVRRMLDGERNHRSGVLGVRDDQPADSHVITIFQRVQRIRRKYWATTEAPTLQELHQWERLITYLMKLPPPN